MKWRKLCRLSAILLMAAFVAHSSNARGVPLAFATGTIQEKEEEIEQTKQERDALEQSKTDMEHVRDELSRNKEDLNNYVEQLDGTLSDIQLRINELDTQIEGKREQIEQTQAELDDAVAVQNEQYAEMKERIRFMYERGNQMTMELLFEAGSFSDMLNKAQYILQLSEYDRSKLDEYIGVVQMVSLTKQHLEEEKLTLEEAVATQEEEQANMQALITEKNNEIYGLSESIAEQEASIEAYEEQIRQREAELAQLEEELKNMRYAGVYDGGMFVWPCPSYIYISSDFGYRTGTYSGFHNGVDMAAPGGTPILAAYSGLVKAAGYSSSMGNYVWIDHGSGLETIYMHASALMTSAGATVGAGEVIALVGTTGWSTGNHLHFSVKVNGNYVSPWQYLTG